MINPKKALARVMGAVAMTLAVVAMPTAAAAQSVEQDSIERKNIENGKVTLSTERGYIFMQGPARMNAAFIKTPNAQDIAEYEAEWEEELAEAIDKYPRRLERWKKRKAAGRNPGERPIEPTPESFSIGEIERRMMVHIGPQYVYDKGKDASGEKFFQYLHEVEPGEYTYYGPIFYDGTTAFGVCSCMGSVRFEVKAGEITSIGDFMLGGWADDEAQRLSTPFFEPSPDRLQGPINFTVPANLNSLPSVDAEFHAAGKMNNFFRIGIGRIPPMEGVLRYERDTVIDVRAEIAAAEEARLKAEAISGAEARLAEAQAKFNEANEAAKVAEAALTEEATPEMQAAAQEAIEAATNAEIEMITAEEELAELTGTAPPSDEDAMAESEEDLIAEAAAEFTDQAEGAEESAADAQ